MPSVPKYLEKLRNIGVIAHIDAGKTTFTERVLYYSRRIHRMGEVHDGAATMDFLPEEQERGITITSACTSTEWLGHTINVIDTPGHVDFTIEVERSLRVLDGAVGVFDAVAGVEPQSETVWRQSEKFLVPKLAFVNKMDRPGADFMAAVEGIRSRLKANAHAVQLPVGQGADFEAVIDLVSMRRLDFDPADAGMTVTARELSPEEREAAAPAREALLEALADRDEAFMETYLAAETVDEADIRPALRRAVIGRALTPVFCGAALRNIGVQPVLDAVCHYLPGPLEAPPVVGLDPVTREKRPVHPELDAPFTALVFKIAMDSGRKVVLLRVYSGRVKPGDLVSNVAQGKEERVARLFRMHADHKERLEAARVGDIVAAAGLKDARTGDTLCGQGRHVVLEAIDSYKPVISLALEPKNKEEGDKLDEVMDKFLQEDPTLFLALDEDTGQRLISGMGELHLEVVLERLKREYGLSPRAGNPQVVRRATVTARARAEASFARELGGVLHQGFVALEVAPRTRAEGEEGALNRVVLAVDREGWPQALVDAVHDAVARGLENGVDGHPAQGVRATVTDLGRRGQHTSEAGLSMAASQALRQALAQAVPVFLEPLMWLEITVPEERLGEVMSLLGARGAKVENLGDKADRKLVQALAPMARLFGFSTALRSATQGRAGLIMRFERFDRAD